MNVILFLNEYVVASSAIDGYSTEVFSTDFNKKQLATLQKQLTICNLTSLQFLFYK